MEEVQIVTDEMEELLRRRFRSSARQAVENNSSPVFSATQRTLTELLPLNDT